jgi:hypothetical protein
MEIYQVVPITSKGIPLVKTIDIVNEAKTYISNNICNYGLQ